MTKFGDKAQRFKINPHVAVLFLMIFFSTVYDLSNASLDDIFSAMAHELALKIVAVAPLPIVKCRRQVPLMIAGFLIISFLSMAQKVMSCSSTDATLEFIFGVDLLRKS